MTVTRRIADRVHAITSARSPYPQHTLPSRHVCIDAVRCPGASIAFICSWSTVRPPYCSITESRQLQGAPWPLLVNAVGIKLARVLYLLCR